MKSLIKLVLATLFVSNTALADDAAAVKTLIAEYETALNASETSQVMKLYSSQPTFMPQHAPAQVGRDAVKQAYDGVFSAIDLDIEFTTHEVEVLGDTAWARTSSAGKTRILANDAVITEGNNELFVFKKEAGQWKIYQYLFATNQPRQ